jgi:hypothetical protein
MNTFQYTILPLVPDGDQVKSNPVDYLGIVNSLGDAGFELVTVYNDCMIFKKTICSNTEK